MLRQSSQHSAAEIAIVAGSGVSAVHRGAAVSLHFQLIRGSRRADANIAICSYSHPLYLGRRTIRSSGKFEVGNEVELTVPESTMASMAAVCFQSPTQPPKTLNPNRSPFPTFAGAPSVPLANLARKPEPDVVVDWGTVCRGEYAAEVLAALKKGKSFPSSF